MGNTPHRVLQLPLLVAKSMCSTSHACLAEQESWEAIHESIRYCLRLSQTRSVIPSSGACSGEGVGLLTPLEEGTGKAGACDVLRRCNDSQPPRGDAVILGCKDTL